MKRNNMASANIRRRNQKRKQQRSHTAIAMAESSKEMYEAKKNRNQNVIHPHISHTEFDCKKKNEKKRNK